jgi:hypothetical protein
VAECAGEALRLREAPRLAPHARLRNVWQSGTASGEHPSRMHSQALFSDILGVEKTLVQETLSPKVASKFRHGYHATLTIKRRPVTPPRIQPPSWPGRGPVASALRTTAMSHASPRDRAASPAGIKESRLLWRPSWGVLPAPPPAPHPPSAKALACICPRRLGYHLAEYLSLCYCTSAALGRRHSVLPKWPVNFDPSLPYEAVDDSLPSTGLQGSRLGCDLPSPKQYRRWLAAYPPRQ